MAAKATRLASSTQLMQPCCTVLLMMIVKLLTAATPQTPASRHPSCTTCRRRCCRSPRWWHPSTCPSLQRQAGRGSSSGGACEQDWRCLLPEPLPKPPLAATSVTQAGKTCAQPSVPVQVPASACTVPRAPGGGTSLWHGRSESKCRGRGGSWHRHQHAPHLG